MHTMPYFQNYLVCGIIFVVLFSFLVSYKLYPVIIYLSYVKKLFQLPEKRSSHIYNTPTMGGIGIFFGFTLTFVFVSSVLSKYTSVNTFFDLIASLLILLFIGVEDDLLVISPFKKLAAQLLAAAIVIMFLDVRITGFDGAFGINELPYFVSLLFTFFTFILVINAYNLIDGVDGLAGIIALIICAFFGFYFFINMQFGQLLISFSLAGSLLAFLKFNLSRSRKIFMGDSGSMVVGFIIMYQSTSFLTVNNSYKAVFYLKNGPVFILALLAFPLIDTLRVFIIRLKNGTSPFRPDRNHIHHCFLDLGFTHLQTTMIISFLSLLIIGLAFFLQDLYINESLFLLLIISLFAYLPFTFKTFK